VTRRRRSRRLGSLTKVESHELRSLFAAEQLALRLALGVAAPEAWRAVAVTNHFPVGSAMPADTTKDALVLVEQLRAVARRSRRIPIRHRIALLAAPLLTCLLPASVIILLL
jgi:signal transduction histidine kinase